MERLVHRAPGLDKGIMHPVLAPAVTIARMARDFALPPRCPGCGLVVEGDHRFCLQCWQRLDFLPDIGCTACGRPMDGGEGLTCGACLAHPPLHDGVRAAVAYGEVARGLALKLKYSGRTAMADIIAAQLVRHVDSAADGLLVPVPLHRWRIWRRGYNQSALIARSLAARTGAAMSLDALQRTRATPALRGMGAAARAKTVRGAFAVPADRRALVTERNIWLVDDVHTSGATANACARALKRAGAARVVVLCWARVLADEY
jgi:ComF family protein